MYLCVKLMISFTVLVLISNIEKLYTHTSPLYYIHTPLISDIEKLYTNKSSEALWGPH